MAVGAMGRARLSLDDDGLIPVSPIFLPNYRVRFLDSTTVLTAPYQAMFTETGAGKLVGFILDFSQGFVKTKLTIDSNVIFELTDANILDMMVGSPQDTGPASQNTSGGPTWENAGSRLSFYPPYPIKYATEVKIESLKTAGTPSFNRYMVNLTEE